MPTLPVFTAKPIKGLKQKDWGKETLHKFNRQEANYSKSDYLRFKPELIYKLAKPFTSIQEMMDYEGENQEKIKAASQLLWKGVVDRPSWFIENRRNNSETVDECIEILSKVSTIEEIYEDNDYLRILNRLWLFRSKNEVKKILSHLNWKRRDWVNPKEDDIYIYNIISKYKSVVEIRNKKVDKSLITRLQIDKGEKYPKSYALYLKMTSKTGNKKGSKRGIYKKRGTE